MARIDNLSNYLEDIADAIRTKKETDEDILASEFDTEILTIEDGIDTSDATASSVDILSPRTAYVNGEKITGVIGIVYDKIQSSRIVNTSTSGISDVSSDGVFNALGNRSTIVITNLQTNKSENVTAGGSGNISSLRFSPIIDKDLDGNTIYLLMTGKVRHDNDYFGCTFVKLVVDKNGDFTTQTYSASFGDSWHGSQSTIYPSINRQGVFAISNAHRQSRSRIVIVQLDRTNIIFKQYLTGVSTGENLVTNGEWSGDIFYMSYPTISTTRMFRIDCTFANERLSNIRGTSMTVTDPYRSYTMNYYMEKGVLYNLDGTILNNYIDIIGDVKITTVNDEYLYIMALQNSKLCIFTIDLATYEIETGPAYDCTVSTWQNTGSSSVLADKVRVKLDADNIFCLDLSSSQTISELHRENLIYYSTYKSNIVSNDIRQGKIAYGPNGKVVGSYEPAITQEEYNEALIVANQIKGGTE